MALATPISAGLVTLVLVSYLMHDQSDAVREILAISKLKIFDYQLFWSWPVFGLVTVLVWLLGKAVGDQ